MTNEYLIYFTRDDGVHDQTTIKASSFVEANEKARKLYPTVYQILLYTRPREIYYGI